MALLPPRPGNCDDSCASWGDCNPARAIRLDAGVRKRRQCMRKTTFLLALACLAGSAWPSDAEDAPRTTGWVVLPVSEYAALRGRAMPPAIEPPAPPAEAT